jgi:hypothetical protein
VNVFFKFQIVELDTFIYSSFLNRVIPAYNAFSLPFGYPTYRTFPQET